MYKYLEIVKDEGNEVVKRLNVSNKSERSIEKIENAMNNFNKAIQLYPSNGPALFYRGSLKIALGDTAGACADWEKSKSFNYPQASKLLEKFCNKK